ncbi:MAG TPA: MFS transporter [Sphingobacterium sp.]|nr:MFS transporter [Sphingobacterium sp.]
MKKPLSENKERKTRLKRIFLLLGVIFIASNLRAPLTSVGPVVSDITEALSLSNTAAGLITTIPLLAFGFLSGLVPRVSQKHGMETVLMFSLFLLMVGLIVRSLGNVSTLFIGAALVGTAITVGNVLMPAFIKNHFPSRIGVVTGVYSVVMNLIAALAAGFSIRLGEVTQLGWKGSIGIWIILTCITTLIWLPQLYQKPKSQNKTHDEKIEKSPTRLYSSRLAWAVTLFMGLQSLLFYCLAAWLPKAVQSWGMSPYESGWILSIVQLAQLPTTFLGAVIASRMKDQKSLSIWIGVLFLIGISGIIIWRTEYIIICCILIGISGGLAFSLAMLFFALRTQNATQAAHLSGMAQGIGYLIAGAGPPLFGGLYDMTHSWTISFIFLLIMSGILMVVGIIAGKNQTI